MTKFNDRYEILTQIGDGGMANVYLAKDLKEERHVAIKVLRGELANDPVALVRFQREANAATTLNHPNIVKVYDVGNDNNKHYIVMEYVRGKSLKQVINRRGAIPFNEALYIMKELTEAIIAAHDKGIIHRDIKPQNILITDDGSIKITDFGIAMAQDALQLTVSDSVMGSVHYLAPELAKGTTASFQSDIYSLGIVFYEMLSGELPYRADAPVQIALKHIKEEMPYIKDQNPEVPQSIENVIIRATAKSPSQRYSSCKEMLVDIANYEKNESTKRLVLNKVESSDSLEQTAVLTTDSISKINSDSSNKRSKKKKTPLTTIVIASLLGVISVALVVALLFFSGIIQLPKKTVAIPDDIIGMNYQEATELLNDLDLIVSNNITWEMTDDIEENNIISLSVEPGDDVEVGTIVQLTVSEGIWYIVEDYVGRTADEVEMMFKNAQMNNVTILIDNKIDVNVAEGTILEQSGLVAGDKINPKLSYQIHFYVASKTTIIIPGSVVGLNVNDAKAHLEAMGIKVKTEVLTLETGDVTTANVVVRINPEGGTSFTQGADNYVTLYYYDKTQTADDNTDTPANSTTATGR
ncbi:MAG: Stk1 family PASTA domain-containing Ser/Thr kinase [Erysipelotrichaceae bacterium]